MKSIPVTLFICLLLGLGITSAFQPDPALAEPLPANEQQLPGKPDLQLTPDNPTEIAATLLKVCGALVLVVGLLVIAIRLIKKLGIGSGPVGSRSLIEVIETRMIAPKRYVTVLKVADELLALGVTEQQINLLAHLEQTPATMEHIAKRPAPQPFSAVLKKTLRTFPPHPEKNRSRGINNDPQS